MTTHAERGPKRYTHDQAGVRQWPAGIMRESPDGEWVKYAELAAGQAAERGYREALEKIEATDTVWGIGADENMTMLRDIARAALKAGNWTHS